MTDFLWAALILAVLIAHTAALGASAWPADRGALAVRLALGLLAALIYVAVFLQVWTFDKNFLTLMVAGVPQQQQVRPPQGPPPADQQPAPTARPQG